ncbi:MAG: transporter substrate-binding domain-containing protein [Cellvibrio sp.]|uniref:hypothetical protein n=1 Tax=Cellvibrio sp. TaxID=1965322 RepID=UPI0031A44805
MRLRLWIILLAAIAPLTQAETGANHSGEILVVSYKRSEFGDTQRKTFEQSAIELALAKTAEKTGTFEMVPVNVISRPHAIAALNQDKYENFVMTLSYEDELLANKNLIYIPFPLELGAHSYRICYTNKNLTEKVREIKNLQQLQQYKIGVGAGWLDAKILQHHGLQIVEGTNITSLFRMTQAGRVDIFCPSPAEYFHELKTENATDLQLDNKLALYYPLPKFIFSNKNNQALMDRIKKGIEIAYKDGSYMQLWREANEQDIARAKLNERHFIKMHNPFISTLDDEYQQYLIDPLTN